MTFMLIKVTHGWKLVILTVGLFISVQLYLQDPNVGALWCSQDITSSNGAKWSFNFQETPHDGLIVKFLEKKCENQAQSPR